MLTIMSIMHTEFPEEDARELYESMDDDGDKKVAIIREDHMKQTCTARCRPVLCSCVTIWPSGVVHRVHETHGEAPQKGQIL